MTLRYSTGAANNMCGRSSFKDTFNNGRIEIYSGAQPATADAAVTGTLLCTITETSSARTSEVLASGTVTLNSGSSGSVDSITVNGVEILGASVAYSTSLTVTAAAVAAQCQSFRGSVEYNVTSSGAVITITALPGTGTAPNTFAVVSTVTTLTKTDVNLSGGVAAVNGLKFGSPTGGVTAKNATTWSGVNVATGTAGYYRFYGSVADAGTLDSNGVVIREDGAIATSGAEMTMPSTSLTSGATTTITTWQRTVPLT